MLLFAVLGFAQKPTQTIRGSVLDQQSEVPLIGVTVELLDAPEATGSITEPDGSFALENVPVGRQTLRFSYIGYEGVTIPNIVVTAGKEVFLEVKMAESLVQLNEVVVTAQVDKDKAVIDHKAWSHKMVKHRVTASKEWDSVETDKCVLIAFREWVNHKEVKRQ